MVKFSSLSFLILGLLVFPACDKNILSPINKTEGFENTPTENSLKPIIEEVSGIADSKVNPGKLWVQEDSGRPNQIQFVEHTGKVITKITVKGTVNRDWEDMALSGTDLFIGDIGDNDSKYPEYSFYQFAEPTLATDTVRDVKTIRFQYPDGSHDAEAFIVDPQTKNIYIITKRDNPGKLYQITYPYNYTAVNQAILVGSTKYTGIVSAAVSPDGQEMLLKSYASLYYYKRSGNESILEALQKDFTNLPYNIEPQGEAVTFAADNSGIFTLSEKGLATTVNLNFYKRK
ncbi:hypothetical protein [Adhaeribacter pallidiroseus]|uniref:PE-PGRS family protein n=1 Tax=Adhaeribacter pallidiroseus TaxID=2072847 RepID=A0A369QFM7_9BACT|nr:hypothetical protein [Adhaeribacter pallidiroseus]RDC63232.1 hypothetical protein AHMF7616_01833 [Adhaeribacter pallidiroseus]